MSLHGFTAEYQLNEERAKLNAVRKKLDSILEAIELNWGEEDEDGETEIEGVIDADLIYEDLVDLRALLK